MAFCTKCGKQNLDNAKFCIDCGTPISQHSVISLAKSKKKWLIIGILIGAVLIAMSYFVFYKKGKTNSEDTIEASKTNIDDLIGTWEDPKSGEHVYVYKEGEQHFWLDEGKIEGGIILKLETRKDGICFQTMMADGGSERYLKLYNRKFKKEMISMAISGCGCCIKYSPAKDQIVLKDEDVNETVVYKRINKENKSFDLDEIIMKKLNKMTPQ